MRTITRQSPTFSPGGTILWSAAACCRFLNRKLASSSVPSARSALGFYGGSKLANGKAAVNCRTPKLLGIALLIATLIHLSSCTKVRAKGESSGVTTVGVTKVTQKTLQRQITLSSELVPFQEIDVYAKESGFVKNLYVDYGSRVRAGQLLATLEIPELEAQLQEDEAAIKNATDEVARAEHQLKRYQAQYKVLHLEYTRLNGVFESQPGLVAQQEVDDAQGKDLAAASQVDAGESALEAAQSQLLVTKAKLIHDQTLFSYSRITA
ncbi:MAG TPA: biotin/lipoyl-binding protein, partial [Terriglobia bacterium]|nr:biotin/lipoyl-binding protein [Terriglobia bacterium]